MQRTGINRWVRKVCVVTGASSGIGEAIARDLVREGMIVVGLARRRDRLENIENTLRGEKGTFHGYQCDIGDENNVVGAFKWIKESLGGVHVLVNNAGVAFNATIIDADASIFRKVFDVNVLGLLYCSQQALRQMREARFEGTIVNINSLVGHQFYAVPGPKRNVYQASKRSVTGILESLQYELRDEKMRIRLTNVSPGIVKTEFTSGRNLDHLQHLEPEDIASAVKYILSVPQNVQITELSIRPLGQSF